MRILGIDPGSLRTGWGVVERQGTRLIGHEAGVIVTPKGQQLPNRLLHIHTELTAIISKHRPQAVAVEDIFFAKHANAALKLGHARGTCLLAAAQADLMVHSYPPTVVKKAVVGRGRASKDQVARIVGAILGWKALPKVDATDALAVAITHAQTSSLRRPGS